MQRAQRTMLYKLFQGLSRTAHQLTGAQMATTLDAYATMRHNPGHTLLNRLGEEVQSRGEKEMDPTIAAQTVMAYAVLGYSPPAPAAHRLLRRAVAARDVENPLEGKTAEQVADLAWSTVRGVSSRTKKKACRFHLPPLFPLFLNICAGTNITQVRVAHTAACDVPPSLVAALPAAAMTHAPQLPPRHLAQLLWAVVTAGQRREEMRTQFDAAVATLTQEAATRRVGSFDREALRHLALLPTLLEVSSWGGLNVTLPPGLKVRAVRFSSTWRWREAQPRLLFFMFRLTDAGSGRREAWCRRWWIRCGTTTRTKSPPSPSCARTTTCPTSPTTPLLWTRACAPRAHPTRRGCGRAWNLLHWCSRARSNRLRDEPRRAVTCGRNFYVELG